MSCNKCCEVDPPLECPCFLRNKDHTELVLDEDGEEIQIATSCCYALELGDISNDDECQLCLHCDDDNKIYYMTRGLIIGCGWTTTGCNIDIRKSCISSLQMKIYSEDGGETRVLEITLNAARDHYFQPGIRTNLFNDVVIFKKSFDKDFDFTTMDEEDIPLDQVTNFKAPKKGCMFDGATAKLTSIPQEEQVETCVYETCEPTETACIMCYEPNPLSMKVDLPDGFNYIFYFAMILYLY
jgi:hypothetical protein